MFRFGKTPALFGVVIIIIAAGVWLAGHSPDSAPPVAPAPSKMVGKSALSHGGLPRESDAISPDRAPAPFTIGERVIVDPSAARPQLQPAQRTAASAPPAGKKMIITAIKTSGPDRPERSYEVQSLEGWTGWVPESALVRDTADPEGGAP